MPSIEASINEFKGFLSELDGLASQCRDVRNFAGLAQVRRAQASISDAIQTLTDMDILQQFPQQVDGDAEKMIAALELKAASIASDEANVTRIVDIAASIGNFATHLASGQLADAVQDAVSVTSVLGA